MEEPAEEVGPAVPDGDQLGTVAAPSLPPGEPRRLREDTPMDHRGQQNTHDTGSPTARARDDLRTANKKKKPNEQRDEQRDKEEKEKQEDQEPDDTGDEQ